MGVITALTKGRGRNKQVNIYVDGRRVLTLAGEMVAQGGLVVGREVTDEQVAALAAAERLRRITDVSVHLLAYRPRSEAELRTKLRQRGYHVDEINKVIGQLKEQQLLDDNAFARFWTENRERFSPRSRYLTQRELKQKGVAVEVIEQVIGGVDEVTGAYQAAQRQASRLQGLDYPIFRQRLGVYLRRRGFNYDIIDQTVNRLWQERSA